MTPLYMVELRPNMRAFLKFLHGQGLLVRDGNEDLGYGVHAWLRAAFGERAPQPWRLLHDGTRPTRILGYSLYDAVALKQRLKEFAEPSVFSVCPDPGASIASRPMPNWRTGRRLGFEVQCCPVGRKAGTGIEKDIFLIRADHEKETQLNRENVYREWVLERFERDKASDVVSCQLAGFRLVRQIRKGVKTTAHRKRSYPVRPTVLLRGELVVGDPDAFSALLSRGIGRHRSFGYGMVLVRPPV